MKVTLFLAAGLCFCGDVAVAQEDPGQMGTKAQPPNVTTPKAPAPQMRGEQPSVDKPETSAPAPSLTVPARTMQPGPLSRQPAPALSMNTPNAAELQRQIEIALRREPSLSAANIVVNISDDAIDISGNASTNKERLVARRIVSSFAANRRVRERMSVAGAAAPETAASKPGVPNRVQIPTAKTAPAQPSLAPGPVPPDNRSQTDAKKDGDKSEKPR